MQAEKSGHSSTRPRGPRQQDHNFMNACILSNPHVRQKQNEKKAFDRVKKKVKLEWDELQDQAQQMRQIKWPLLVCLTSKMLSIIGIPAWGVGFIPQSAWVHLEKDKNLVETIQASRVAYAKTLKVNGAFKSRHWSPINVIESKKWM
jgi:hypothetical protein